MNKYKVVKFDFKKIEEGIEFWDCIKRSWLKVKVIHNKNENTLEFESSFSNFYFFNLENWELKGNGGFNPITAMRIKIKPEDVPTINYKMGEHNYIIKKSPTIWYIDYPANREVFGTKYYTKENAELVCDLLNEESD